MRTEERRGSLHKVGSMLKLRKGAKRWTEANLQTKLMRLQDGVLTYSDGGKQGGTSIDLLSVAHLCSSVIPGAPAEAFDMTVRSKPPRTYTFATTSADMAENWLHLLASSVPEQAVHENLRILFRKPALVAEAAAPASNGSFTSSHRKRSMLGSLIGRAPSFGRATSFGRGANSSARDLSSASAESTASAPAPSPATASFAHDAAIARAKSAVAAAEIRRQADPPHSVKGRGVGLDEGEDPYLNPDRHSLDYGEAGALDAQYSWLDAMTSRVRQLSGRESFSLDAAPSPDVAAEQARTHATVKQGAKSNSGSWEQALTGLTSAGPGESDEEARLRSQAAELLRTEKRRAEAMAQRRSVKTASFPKGGGGGDTSAPATPPRPANAAAGAAPPLEASPSKTEALEAFRRREALNAHRREEDAKKLAEVRRASLKRQEEDEAAQAAREEARRQLEEERAARQTAAAAAADAEAVRVMKEAAAKEAKLARQQAAEALRKASAPERAEAVDVVALEAALNGAKAAGVSGAALGVGSVKLEAARRWRAAERALGECMKLPEPSSGAADEDEDEAAAERRLAMLRAAVAEARAVGISGSLELVEERLHDAEVAATERARVAAARRAAERELGNALPGVFTRAEPTRLRAAIAAAEEAGVAERVVAAARAKLPQVEAQHEERSQREAAEALKRQEEAAKREEEAARRDAERAAEQRRAAAEAEAKSRRDEAERMAKRGLEANKAGDAAAARECFLTSYRAHRKPSVLLSAANMALKMGDAATARREYTQLLEASSAAAPAVAAGGADGGTDGLSAALLQSVGKKLREAEAMLPPEALLEPPTPAPLSPSSADAPAPGAAKVAAMALLRSSTPTSEAVPSCISTPQTISPPRLSSTPPPLHSESSVVTAKPTTVGTHAPAMPPPLQPEASGDTLGNFLGLISQGKWDDAASVFGAAVGVGAAAGAAVPSQSLSGLELMRWQRRALEARRAREAASRTSGWRAWLLPPRHRAAPAARSQLAAVLCVLCYYVAAAWTPPGSGCRAVVATHDALVANAPPPLPSHLAAISSGVASLADAAAARIGGPVGEAREEWRMCWVPAPPLKRCTFWNIRCKLRRRRQRKAFKATMRK